MASVKAILLCTSVVLSVAGCGVLFDYPPDEDEASSAACADGIDNDLDGRSDCNDSECIAFCPESNAAACADHIDNDLDGLVDCEDSAGCAGFCPEASAVDCSDGIDNDGDLLLDESDPRCWLLAPPLVQRCAVRSEIRFFESFDLVPYYSDQHWFAAGAFVDGDGSEHAIVDREEFPPAPGYMGTFRFNASEDTAHFTALGSMTMKRLFLGTWPGFELSFDTVVPVGSVLRVRLVPEALAPDSAPPRPGADTALLGITLDNTTQPPVFALDVDGVPVSRELPSVDLCRGSLCNDGLRRVTLKVVDGAFEARVAGSDVVLSLPVRSETLPPSRLVLWGGSWSPDLFAGIDNLLLRIPPAAPCGFPVPQLPSSSCSVAEQLDSVGKHLSVARRPDGVLCAVVTGTTESGQPVLSAWTSEDGERWRAARDDLLEIEGADAFIGASIVHDGVRFRTAVTYRENDKVRLALAKGRTCARLDYDSEFEPSLLLPPDAEAPSYVGGTDELAIYFTRPPTDEADRTLWRISGADEASLAIEPYPIAELESVGTPVTLQRVGAHDLVLTYPELANDGVSTFGVAVSTSDDPGSAWTEVEWRDASTSAGGELDFDTEGVTGVSLGWERDRGFLLYAGSRGQTSSIGTARLFAAGTTIPEASTCGDGECEAPEESCETCAVDCSCPGVLLYSQPSNPDLEWTSLTEGDLQPRVFFDGDFVGWPGRGATTLELETPVQGDFELAFDLDYALVDPSYSTSCYLQVGLESALGEHLTSAGIYASFGDHFCGPGLRGEPSVYGPDSISSADHLSTCDAPALDVTEDLVQRFVLRREGGRVTLGSADAGSCDAAAIEYTGALPPLVALYIGATYDDRDSEDYCSASISALSLRLLDDPEACDAPRKVCDRGGHSYCVDVTENQEHCGSCGKECPPHADCDDGECVCGDGRRSCDGGCHDLDISTAHCGACNHACESHCLLGECDAGEGCAAPKHLSPEGGSFDFEIDPQTTELRLCEDESIRPDFVFAWTPSKSGQATFRLKDHSFTDTVLGVALEETCEVPGEWLACNEASEVTLQVQAGTTYDIVVALYDGYYEQPEPVTLEITLM